MFFIYFIIIPNIVVRIHYLVKLFSSLKQKLEPNCLSCSINAWMNVWHNRQYKLNESKITENVLISIFAVSLLPVFHILKINTSPHTRMANNNNKWCKIEHEQWLNNIKHTLICLRLRFVCILYRNAISLDCERAREIFQRTRNIMRNRNKYICFDKLTTVLVLFLGYVFG